jgi:hypothetical protein
MKTRDFERNGWRAAIALGLMLCAQQGFSSSLSDLPDVSLLTPYATFGHSYVDSAVTINGPVGISDNGNLNLMAPSTINGNLYLGTGATYSGPGVLNGSVVHPGSLAAAQAEVGTASGVLAGLTANQTLGAVNSALTINSANGVADVYVLDISSLTLGSGQNITFNGDAGDVFVLNVTGSMSMTGDATIVAGLDASHVFVNVTDTGNLGTIAHVGNVIYGTVLIPNATSVTFHSVDGAIWSGANTTVTLQSDATVNYVPYLPPPPTVPDGGASLLLLSMGLGLLGVARMKLVA